MKVWLRLAGFSVGLGVWATSLPASAWVESRVLADDVRVELERSGSATIEHAVTMQVRGGPLRAFDLPLGDTEIEPLDGTVASAQTENTGVSVPLALASRPDGALHVTIDTAKGLSRGTFSFHVRYKKNLVAAAAANGSAAESLRRDGAMLRVAWTGAAWPEGLDNAKCTFVVPAAPTEPRPPGIGTKGEIDEDDDSEAGIFMSEVKRLAASDEIELVRAHVARGEAVRWSVRVDPHALGEVRDPRLIPPPLAAPPPIVAPEKRAAYAGAAGALLLGFSLLAFLKAQQVKRIARGAAFRTVLPLATPLRVLLAGPLLVAGAALQLAVEDPIWGTLVILVAMALVWYRKPSIVRAPRGPGRWLPLSDAEAFARPKRARGSWLDARTRSGGITFALLLAAWGAFAYAASRASAYEGWLALMDGAILFPIFGTGSRRDLPPDPMSGPGPALGRIARKLRGRKWLRAIAWARLPEGSDSFDELRLLCAPKVPLRGFTGIEVGLMAASGAGGFIQLPEILVRVVDASPCHEALVQRFPGLRWIRGRRLDERVASFRPRLPTIAMTYALALRLLEQTIDTAPPRTTLPRPSAPRASRRAIASAPAPSMATATSP
jgi:hypothetical protein